MDGTDAMTGQSHRDFAAEFADVPAGIAQPETWPGFRRVAGLAGHRLALILADLLAALLAFAIAIAVASVLRDMIGRPYHSVWRILNERGNQLFFMLLLLVPVFAFGGLYSRAVRDADEVRRVFLGAGLLALLDVTVQFVLNQHSSRLWFVVAWPIFALLTLFLRQAVRAIPSVRRTLTSHMLLVGTGIAADEFAFQLRESQANPVSVLAGPKLASLAEEGPAALPAAIAAAARHAGIDPARIEIALVPSDGERPQSRLLARRLEAAGLPFFLALPLDAQARRGLRLHRITGLDMVLAEYAPPGFGLADRALKRGFDLLAALALLALLALPMLVIAILLAAEGPVFFRQARVGRGGRSFQCLKFRSMHPDAEARLAHLLATDAAARAEWGEFQKLAADPRITRTGRFLRRTSLDELPQLLNVVAGSMSLVGPRPIVAPEVPGYDGDHAYYRSPRFACYTACRPGITGLWQVSGRATTNYAERMRLDCWYARNWSFWLDIAILVRTVRVVLFSRTAS
jgi:undecaprenyl-phosphate galactose phosphotransferase